MQFLRPEWLLALLPLAVILLALWRSGSASSNWNRYIAPHLAKLLVSEGEQKQQRNIAYLATAWLITVIALAGPAISKQALPVFQADQARILVMDMSLSMYATDQAPNRLTQAKFKATDLISGFKEGETALVAYAGDAFTISPLTRDKSTLLNLLPTLSPEIMPVRGSNLPAALSQAKSLLAQGGHLRGDIIVITDGVKIDQVNRAKSILADTHYQLQVLALGSQQGAPVKLPNGQLLRDRSDNVVVAKTDYAKLAEIATSTGGSLYQYRSDNSDLNALITHIDQHHASKKTDLDGEVLQDLGPYLALLLVLPLLMSFKHGLNAYLLPILTVSMLFSVAQPVQASAWNSLWQTQNQQAMALFENGEYQQAAELFSDPSWQASAQYNAGNYEQALSLFEQDDSAQGLYNQANSLTRLSQYNEAIKRYETAIELKPDFDDAIHNLELVKKLAEQQDQQNESNQDNQQDQNNQQGQDEQNNQQNQNGDQNQDGQQQDGEQNQDSQQQQDGQPQDGEQNQDSQQQQDDEQQNGQQNQDSQQQNDQQNQDGQSQDAQSQQDSEQPNNEAEMQANSQPADEQPEQGQAAQPQSSAGQSESVANKEDDNATPQIMATQASDEPLPPEMERVLRSLADDPQVLLRNKMQLEYQKRRQQGQTSKDNEQW
ncbi:VWA domain-containing protein [Shewanella waksmanii]|uniref:vWA domain-containing protein n=1 Tax=Shewanella waksmanii TaxID=213783 RepID=UPI003734DC23